MYNIDDPAMDLYNNPTSEVNGSLDGREGGPAPPGLDGSGNVPDSVAADVVSGLSDTGPKRTLPNPGDTQDTVVGNYPTPSPSDIVAAATGPQLPVSGANTPYDIVAAALNANGGPAQHPPSVEQTAFQNQHPSGSFVNPNPNSALSIEQQMFQNAHPSGSFNNQGQQTGGTPSLPNPGATGATSSTTTGAPSALTDDAWKQDFINKFGFFDPAYNSKENFLANAQKGDQVIRKDSKGMDELAEMAKFDTDAAKVYAGLEGPGKGIYGSQLGTDWATGHNSNIVAEIKNAVAGKNQAAIDNLKAQLANVPANPQTNSEAFPVAAQIAADLNTLGATNVRMNGTTISYAPASNPNATAHIMGGDNIPLANWVDVAAYLHNAVTEKQNAAAAAAAPQGTGGNGYSAPRNNYGPPRGGYSPPQQEPPQSPQLPTTGDFTYGNVSGFPAMAGGTPFNNHGQQQYPLITQSGQPRTF